MLKKGTKTKSEKIVKKGTPGVKYSEFNGFSRRRPGQSNEAPSLH